MNQKYRFSSDWIYHLEEEMHWRWYWHQVKLMEGRISNSERIAEIGVGSGFIYNYLKSKGFNIKSIDIDPDKKPDILLNIVECKPEDFKFDTILAFNIFEHIPYEEFISTIDKFKQAGVKKLFIGLPINKKIIFELNLRLGRFLNKSWIIKIPKRKIKTTFHHWELGFREFTYNRIVKDFNTLNFELTDFFKFRLQSFFYFKRDDIK